MYELLKEFIKPELLVLVPVLYLFGVALKRSQVPDKHIPWVLGSVSVTLSFLFVVATSQISDWQEVSLAIFTGATQGALCAGGSVYVNQLLKQAAKSE